MVQAGRVMAKMRTEDCRLQVSPTVRVMKGSYSAQRLAIGYRQCLEGIPVFTTLLNSFFYGTTSFHSFLNAPGN